MRPPRSSSTGKAITSPTSSGKRWHAASLHWNPARKPQNNWVAIVRQSSVFTEKLQSECPPSYLNNESGKFRYYLGEYYTAGFAAFEKLLLDWRDQGTLEGMNLTK